MPLIAHLMKVKSILSNLIIIINSNNKILRYINLSNKNFHDNYQSYKLFFSLQFQIF